MTLEKATEIMYSEFGFKPKKTKLIIHSKEEWKKILINKSEADVCGFYDLLNYEALIPEKASLATLIHEYLGHGSFYEWSVLGMMTAHDLKELHKIEDVIFNKTQGDSRGEDFQKVFMDYYSLKEKCMQQKEEICSIDEGFATWLEYTLLKKMGRNVETWENALRKNIEYYSYFTQLRNYEIKHGTKGLLQRVGF